VDDPVCCEPFSNGKIPVKQGNNREFPRFRATLDLGQSGKTPEKLNFFAKFPEKRNREFISLIREFPIGIRELPGRSREMG